MKESASFSLLCQCLRGLRETKTRSALESKAHKEQTLDWNPVIRLADIHYILPLMFHQLKKNNALTILPEDLQHLLTEVYTFNCQRNDLIYDEINRIASLVNQAGIEPVFIKGSAGLLMNLYDNRGLRMMGDVDLLVYKTDIPTCTKLMQSDGYSPIEGLYMPDADDHYHGFPLVHDRHNIRFEIHERLADDPILDTQAIIEDSVKVQLEEGVVRVPSKTHFIIHNILHHQVFDNGIAGENILLYQLLDLYTIRETFEQQLDWKTIGAFFIKHSHQKAFCFPLDMLKKYFHQRYPKNISFSLRYSIRFRQNRNRFNKLFNRCQSLRPQQVA